MGIREEIRANLAYELRAKHFLLLLLPPPPPFSSKSRGNFVHTVQWDTLPRPLQISECRQPCDLFSVHSSRLLAAPQQAQGPLSRVVGLSAFAWMRYLCIGLFPASLSNHRLVHLTPLSLSLSRAHYLSRSSPRCCPPSCSPYITANNECIRNPTFLCPSVARFFVS